MQLSSNVSRPPPTKKILYETLHYTGRIVQRSSITKKGGQQSLQASMRNVTVRQCIANSVNIGVFVEILFNIPGWL